jgi:hypothetical protein
MVFVTQISLGEVILVPQSPQNFTVSGLSALHFGHFIATSSPYLVGKIISRRKEGVK